MAVEQASQARTAGLIERLRALPSAVISDVLHEMGLRSQVLACSIRAVGAPHKLVGPAFCVRGQEGPEPARGADAPKSAFEMDRRLNAGCVVVIASGGFRAGAVLGGNIGLSFKLHGCAGVLTDGGIRDAEEFIEIGLPVFSSFTTPLAYKGRWHYAELEVPIALEGLVSPVRVQPGDIVHADLDGALIIPREHVEQVAVDAEVVERMESTIKQELEAGTDREHVYRRNDRFGHIKRVL